jgi:CPA1 family monovalent cation:H+ antiporter
VSLTVALLVASLLAALLLEPVARRLRLPFTAVLVAAGFAGSEALVAAGIDTGVRAQGFHDLILYVFLPVLVFESAYHVDGRLLLRNLFPILVLAVPVMLLAAAITAAGLYFGIHHPGFPWLAAILAGVLLSATDPVAVLALFKTAGVPERLSVLVDGESLFNDATVIVLFGIALEMALVPGLGGDWWVAGQRFAVVFFGGIAVGLGVGGVALGLLRLYRATTAKAIITLMAAYFAFLAAEEGLHVSGIMATLAAGLLLGWLGRGRLLGEARAFVDPLWGLVAYVANALIFILMGVTITLSMFTERWLAILIGIGAVLVARAAGLFLILPVVSRLPGVQPIPTAYQAVMFWGGLRGAVTLALALALPTELPYWWTLQSIAFGVVLFTLFVQAPTMPLLLRRLGLSSRA